MKGKTNRCYLNNIKCKEKYPTDCHIKSKLTVDTIKFNIKPKPWNEEIILYR